MIGRELLTGCNIVTCIVTLTIVKVKTDSSQSNYRGEYTIYQTSEVRPLKEYITYTGTVPANGIKYFKFDIARAETVMIIVTPLSSGDPDIFVSKNRLPSQSDFHWSS